MELLLVLMVGLGLMMFLTMRKQRRMVTSQQELQDSLAEGDKVMTTSGMYATVVDTSDDTTIDLEIADGVVTTWLRQAVREKVGPVLEDEDEDLIESDATTEDAEHNGGATVAPPLEHGGSTK